MLPMVNRDAEKLQAASDESYKDPTNLQAKIQKHQAFEAEVAAHSNAIVSLDNTGQEMIGQGHFASEIIQKRLEELHRLWELLLSRLADKGMKLQQALVLVQFLRQCDEVMFWINDKVCVIFPKMMMEKRNANIMYFLLGSICDF